MTAPDKAVTEQLSFPWFAPRRKILGTYRLEGRRSLNIKVTEGGNGELVLSLTADPHRSNADFWYRPERSLTLRLCVRGDPKCTIDDIPSYWNLEGEGDKNGGAFSTVAQWALDEIGADNSDWLYEPLFEPVKILARACGTVARRAAARCDEVARATAMRFDPSVRFFVYSQLVRDRSGRVEQISNACPAVLSLLSLSARDAEPADIEAHVVAIRDGRPLREILASLFSLRSRIEAADRSSEGDPTVAPISSLAVQVWRRAPAAVAPRDLLVQYPPGVSGSDIPSSPTNREDWYRLLGAFAERADRLQLPARAQKRLAGFLSKNASALAAAAAQEKVSLAGLVGEIVDYARRSGRPPPCRRTPSARLLHDLEEWHLDCWSGGLSEIETLVFPEPPRGKLTIPCLEITPIQSPTELIAEGRRMRHCIASFGWQVAQGELAVYHVTFGDEPLTLAISRHPACGWRMQELSGFGNGPASGEARLAVYQWVRALNERGANLQHSSGTPLS